MSEVDSNEFAGSRAPTPFYVARICVGCMLVGTYVVVATVWMLAQLHEPGAASVLRFWRKSLVLYPLRTTFFTAPTVFAAGILSAVAWRLIRGRTTEGWRNVILLTGLIASACWLIRIVAQLVFRRQWFIHSPTFDLITLWTCAMIAACIVCFKSRHATS